MKALTLKKRIIIPHNGFIPLKGINGPVTVPYMETFENISKLLMDRMPVKEVLRDGTTIDLNLMNYDKENSWNASSTEKKFEAVQPISGNRVKTPKQSKLIIVTDDDVKAASMDGILSRAMEANTKTPEHEVDVTNSVSNNVYEHGEAGTQLSKREANEAKRDKKKHKNQDEIFDSK